MGCYDRLLWGNLIDRMSFDPWGQRQYADWADGNPTGGDPDYYPTTKGYTGHEMLDQVNLIHMDGRVYDPVIGRFLSPDLLISSPDNSQSFNRYSYVLNNPLSLVDPSGYDPNDTCPDCSDNIFSHGHQNQPPCQATTCYNDADAEAFRDQMVMQSYDGWGASGIYFQDSTGQYFAQQADPFQNVDLNVNLSQGNGEQNSSQESTSQAGFGDNGFGYWGGLIANGVGLAAGVRENYLKFTRTTASGWWLGKNGRWYPSTWPGTKFSGSLSKTLGGLKAFGTGMFFIGATFSTINGAQNAANGNWDRVSKNSADIAIGYIGTFGGWPGLITAGSYYAIDYTIGIETFSGPITDKLCSATGNC